mgnify:CR=1 FL=1
MRTIKSPNNILNRDEGSTTVFLAGSIEMGRACNWQQTVEQRLKDYKDDILTIFNPRRKKFDETILPNTSDARFVEQVEWELDAMEKCDYIFMYFVPGTLSPITLLELGLHADNIAKLIVCCPGGFWREGNIEIVCKKYNIPFHRNFDDALEQLRGWIDCDHGS